MADEKVPLFMGTHPLGNRPGGPYLDDLQLREAETRRAMVEGREPDYSAESLAAGSPAVPMVPAAVIIDASPMSGVTSSAVVNAITDAALDDSNDEVVPVAVVDSYGDNTTLEEGQQAGLANPSDASANNATVDGAEPEVPVVDPATNEPTEPKVDGDSDNVERPDEPTEVTDEATSVETPSTPTVTPAPTFTDSEVQ